MTKVEQNLQKEFGLSEPSPKNPALLDIMAKDKLTLEDDLVLGKIIQSGKEPDVSFAIKELYERNRGVIGKIVKGFHHVTIPNENFFQAGCLGLLKAAYKYDPNIGNRFVTYAEYDIWNEMRNVLIKERVGIYSTEDMYRLHHLINRYIEEYLRKNKREPSIDQIAQGMGRSKAYLLKANLAESTARDIDAFMVQTSSSDGRSLDAMGRPFSPTEHQALNHKSHRLLTEKLESIFEKEMVNEELLLFNIICRLLGLRSYKPASQKKIAEDLFSEGLTSHKLTRAGIGLRVKKAKGYILKNQEQILDLIN